VRNQIRLVLVLVLEFFDYEEEDEEESKKQNRPENPKILRPFLRPGSS
jgi:hypothetical protein